MRNDLTRKHFSENIMTIFIFWKLYPQNCFYQCRMKMFWIFLWTSQMDGMETDRFSIGFKCDTFVSGFSAQTYLSEEQTFSGGTRPSCRLQVIVESIYGNKRVSFFPEDEGEKYFWAVHLFVSVMDVCSGVKQLTAVKLLTFVTKKLRMRSKEKLSKTFSV